MYQTYEKTTYAETLAREIQTASSQRRIALQPKFADALDTLKQSGGVIPPKLRNLHEQVLEEAIEARFDNLPV